MKILALLIGLILKPTNTPVVASEEDDWWDAIA